MLIRRGALLIMTLVSYKFSQGILYPRPSQSREVTSLDGLWNFVVDNGNIGRINEWFVTDLERHENVTLMPVPSSYNDIVVDSNIRDHVGYVWYQKKFFVSTSWTPKRVMLRLSSVCYSGEVWVNTQSVAVHDIGHLPFETDVSSVLKFGEENVVLVLCDNTLLPTTIPQGTIGKLDTDDGCKIVQSYTFDFFNYAGIQRPVVLYTTPKSYIKDIRIVTEEVSEDKATILYDINVLNNDPNNNITVEVKLKVSSGSQEVPEYTDDGPMEWVQQIDHWWQILFEPKSFLYSSKITLEKPQLWWPYLMDPNPGFLYSFEVYLKQQNGNVIDIYRLPIGIRELKWTNSTFTINGRPIYMHGFGKHEDSDFRGRGLDFAATMRDFNLIKWIGANAFRTSHYPYAEEIMDLADRLGIMIIDECPAVNIENFSVELQENHIKSLRELVSRDKNRPSVIAWSIANEPRSQLKGADVYFEPVAKYAKSLDHTRPITASLNREYNQDKLGQYLDIISFNRYNSWYKNEGRLDMIINNVVTEAENWRNAHNKPVLMSEYGADTMEGLHFNPDFIWSEEYQTAVLSKHFRAFDKLRQQSWFIGEFVWNFADFKTAQKITRVGGNKKGVFTRNRQPKMAAHHLRKRYFYLSNELYNSSIPEDLNNYISSHIKIERNEL